MPVTVISSFAHLFNSEAFRQLFLSLSSRPLLHLCFIQQDWERSTRQHMNETSNLQVTHKNAKLKKTKIRWYNYKHTPRISGVRIALHPMATGCRAVASFVLLWKLFSGNLDVPTLLLGASLFLAVFIGNKSR